MSDVDDLFDDVSDEPQQQQQDGSPDEQQQDAGGMEDLEDDMGDEAADEAALFGEEPATYEDAMEPADEQATGEPITVAAPLLQRPPAGKLLLLKMPNFMKIDSMPYDPDTTDIEPEVTGQGKTMRVQANDINVIRWRYRQNDDGSVSRESNARYVEWSDGTESIVLGDEVLTMERQAQPVANTYVHVVRYDAIQGLAHIQEQVQLKPATLNNKLHQRLKLAVHKATQKMDKVQVHLAARNPEQEKLEAEKRAEDQAKLRRSQARVTERTRVPKQRPPMFSASYLEQEEDEEPDYYGAQEREQPEDDYYRRPRDDDEGAARLQSAKRSTPPPPSLRSSKQARVQQQPAAAADDDDDVTEAVETAKAAAVGLKVRRGAILDDEDDD